jgi:hypothetical protein
LGLHRDTVHGRVSPAVSLVIRCLWLKWSIQAIPMR